MPYEKILYSDGAWDDYCKKFPATPLRVRFFDFLVTNFPRRLFLKLFPMAQEKLISHVLLFRNDLQTIPAFEVFPNLSLVKADRDMISSMAAHEEAYPPTVFQNRIEAGDECYCLIHEGELVSYNWISYRGCSVFYGFSKEVRFKDLQTREAFLYDFYTYSKVRGKGYGMALKKLLLTKLRNQGICSIFGYVSVENPLSAKIQLTLGARLYRIFYIYRIMSLAFSLSASEKESDAAVKYLDEVFAETG